MKKKIYVVLLAVAIMMIFNLIIPNASYASVDGGELLEPVMKLLTAICDAIIDILQKVLLGIEGDAFWSINRTGDIFANILGFLGAIVVIGISVALAVFFAAPTGGASVGVLIAVGAKAAVMSIGSAIITFFAVSMLTSEMLPGTFHLPFITISPENILQNKIELFNVNYFEIEDTNETNNSEGQREIENLQCVDNEINGGTIVSRGNSQQINNLNSKINEKMVNFGYTGEAIDISSYFNTSDYTEIQQWDNNGEGYIAKIKFLATSSYAAAEPYQVFFKIEKGSYVQTKKVTATVLKETIAKWYYTLRTLAIVCFMLVLIYIGIRILLTSIASEKVKYQKMLTDWLISFCLLFVIHYVMIFSMQIVNTFTDMIGESLQKGAVEYYEITDDKVYDYVEKNLSETDNRIAVSEEATPIEGGQEYTTLYINSEGKKTVRFPVDNFMSQARIEMQLLDKKGNEKLEAIGWMIIYIMLTIFTVRFCFVYLKRVVYIGFLILVAPLVVLTYSIDRLHDGKAQGFDTWIREYLFNLVIQPFHLLIYIVFVGAAMALASNNPIYVLIILGFMTQAEKILRKMFGFEKAQTPGVLSGALGTSLAMSGMQKLFGRKPPHPEQNKNINGGTGKEDNEDSKIKEQNVDEVLGEGISIPTEETPKDIEEEEIEGETYENNTGIADEGEEKQTPSQRFADEIQKQPKTTSSKKKATSPKFNIKRAIKGATRHYIQTKGKRMADRVNNTSLIRETGKFITGGAAALTAGTAGIMLGAAEGSPEKALRNAGIVGVAAYKGASGWIEAEKVEGTMDSFMKAGYGTEYKQQQEKELAREISHNLENRTILEQELGWNEKEIDEFYEKEIEEYISAGVKSLNEMIIGEKMKANEIVSSTKQAIGVMSLGRRIGDTRKLTDDKRQKWADTITAKSGKVAEMQKKIKTMQDQYNKEIEEIQKETISKIEKAKKVSEVEQRRKNDKDITKLTGRIRTIQDDTLKKLDKYSEYKYK